MNAPEFPTPWQRKMLWSALTAVAVVTIGSIGAGTIWMVSHVLKFLQPILVPFAVAAVLAYLLEPVVSKVVRWGTSRHRAVFFVFAVVTILFAGVLIWLIPTLSTQTVNLARKVPQYTYQARARVLEFSDYMRSRYSISILPPGAKPAETSSSPGSTTAPLASSGTKEPLSETAPPEKTTPLTVATAGSAEVPPPSQASANDPTYDLQQFITGDWIQATLRQLITQLVALVRNSLGSVLFIIGFMLSLIIVPIYLYYFLIEGPNIEKSWSDYLPLRASAFKDEVVSVLNEINGYLIAFFRGQLVVSLINGAVTGIGLVAAGLEFGLLIGLALCLLGIIPYLGISMCWIVSVIIASVQGGSWCVAKDPWWVFPLVISGIFIVVHHFDGLFVTPKIVGESVGLHPLTVIFSVFVWSLTMGGLLGAILAVPMTATLKVLLRRYVWARQFREPVIVPSSSSSEAMAAAALTNLPARAEGNATTPSSPIVLGSGGRGEPITQP